MVGSQKNSEPGNLHVRIRVQPPINGPKITGFTPDHFHPEISGIISPNLLLVTFSRDH